MSSPTSTILQLRGNCTQAELVRFPSCLASQAPGTFFLARPHMHTNNNLEGRLH